MQTDYIDYGPEDCNNYQAFTIIGPKLMDNLIEQATEADASSIFIMTTQTADWFEQLGFEEDKIDSIPEERRAIWNRARNSKVFRLKK